MKYIVILIINLFFIQVSHSQIHEFGVFLGGSNFIDDLDGSKFINPSRLSYGGIYKWNRSPRHAWRISGITTYGTGSINNNTDKTIGEISAGLEFNFFEFDLHHSGRQHTPYLFTGVSGVYYKETYIDGGATQYTDKKNLTFGIPIVFGYKYRFSQSFIIAAEVGARYTFTDDLDGSDYIAENGTDYSFGNLNNNDWYVFTGFTLTYTFGRNPCYCD